MQQSTTILQSAHNFSVGGNINVGIYYPQVSEETTASADVARIAQWLSNPEVNYWAFHNEIKSRRTAGTGLWFLDGSSFSQWANGELKALWVTGIPGSGKTVLASASVEQARTSSLPVVYVYCRYVDKCTARDVLCSFLEQLVIEYPAVHALLKPSYDEHRARQTRLSKTEAIQTLADTIALLNDALAIIDGLDEVVDEEKIKLLTILSNLPIRLLIFSRPLELFTELLRSARMLPLMTSDEDIERFVVGRISTHPRLRRLLIQKESLAEQITETVKRKSQGMFLMAALQVDALNGCLNMKSLMKTLDSLPTGINDMYCRTMSRIADQSKEEASLAVLTLLWLTYAQRSLKIEELQDALATSFRDGSYDVDAITESDVILSTCCGLVTVDDSSREVRLIHHTTHEYLQSLTSTSPFSDHAIITTLTCTSYLTHHGYHRQDLQTPEALEAFLSNGLAFMRYAQQFWALHAQQLTQRDHPDACAEVVTFLNRCRPVVYAFPLLNYFNFPYKLNAEYEVLSPCHVAARFGLVEIYTAVEERQHLTPRYRWNALHLAALFDQEAMAMLTFQEGADVDEVDARGRSALHLAAQEGNNSVVKLLLSKPVIKVNLTDAYGSVPLCLAAEEGHDDTLFLLAQHPCIDIDARTRLGESPLLLSLQRCRFTTAHIFLDHPSIDVNANDGRESILLASVRRQQDDLVRKILLRPDLDPNWLPKMRGQTALCEAVVPSREGGVNPILSILLEHPCIDVNATDKSGLSPLTRAIRLDNLEAVRLLIAHPKINPNMRDPDGLSPLLCAIDYRDDGICRAILAHPLTDPNVPSSYGYTPLVITIIRGLHSIFDLLISHQGIDVYSSIEERGISRTALAYALQAQSRHCIKALLDHLAIGTDPIGTTCQLYQLPLPLPSSNNIIVAPSRHVLGLGFDLKEAGGWAFKAVTVALQAGSVDDIKRVAHLHREALQIRPTDHPERPCALDGLPRSLLALVDRTQTAEHFDELISLLREMLALSDHTLPDHPSPLIRRTKSLFMLFRRQEDIGVLEELASFYRQTLESIPDSHPERSIYVDDLAGCLLSQFRHKAKQKPGRSPLSECFSAPSLNVTEQCIPL